MEPVPQQRPASARLGGCALLRFHAGSVVSALKAPLHVSPCPRCFCQRWGRKHRALALMLAQPVLLRRAGGGQDARATAPDRRVDPAALAGRHKGRASKEERLARVHEGREGREFGAASARKKQKTGGTSNRQKARRRWLAARGPTCTLRGHMEGASGRSFQLSAAARVGVARTAFA